MKYKGTFEELKAIIEGAGLNGTWHEKANGLKQFEYKQGGFFNWFDTKKGTVSFQGNQEEKTVLEKLIIPLLDGVPDQVVRAVEANKKVFVVYGHD